MDRQWDDRKKKGQQVQKGSTKHYTEILTLRNTNLINKSGVQPDDPQSQAAPASLVAPVV